MAKKREKMSCLTKISNFFYLLKLEDKDLVFFNKEKAVMWMNNGIRIGKFYKKKSWTRNQLSKHIREVRKQFPYKVIDFSEAKKMYDDYPLMKGSLDYEKLVERLKRGGVVYITCFRDTYPVKGEKYESYFINGSFGNVGKTVKLSWNEKRGVVQEYYNTCKPSEWYIDQDSIKMYRFADKKEIKRFWERREQYQFLQSCRECVYEELRRINEEIAKI